MQVYSKPYFEGKVSIGRRNPCDYQWEACSPYAENILGLLSFKIHGLGSQIKSYCLPSFLTPVYKQILYFNNKRNYLDHSKVIPFRFNYEYRSWIAGSPKTNWSKAFMYPRSKTIQTGNIVIFSSASFYNVLLLNGVKLMIRLVSLASPLARAPSTPRTPPLAYSG